MPTNVSLFELFVVQKQCRLYLLGNPGEVRGEWAVGAAPGTGGSPGTPGTGGMSG